MTNKKLLGQRIQELRKLNGFTQEKLAEAIGIESGSLSAIESGRHFPSLLTLEKIAKKLDTQLQSFFEFHDALSEEEIKQKLRENLEKMRHRDIVGIYKFTEYIKTM